jgi:hypothetical protein
MVDPALQIEKQGANQAPNCANKEFEAKHTKYSCVRRYTLSHAGNGEGKLLVPGGEQAAVPACDGRRQMS